LPSKNPRAAKIFNETKAFASRGKKLVKSKLIQNLTDKESEIESKIGSLEVKKEAHILRKRKIQTKIEKVEDRITELEISLETRRLIKARKLIQVNSIWTSKVNILRKKSL
jgi:hypothetical protein